MKRNTITNISKTILLSFVIICVFNLFVIVIEADDNANNNLTKFKKLESSNISKAGVALTINLATRHSAKKEIKMILSSKLYSVKEVLKNNKDTKQALIFNDLLSTKEYFSILKTDFKTLLKKTSNKQKTLNEIISQLKMRLKLGIKQTKNIEEQKEVLVESLKKIKNQIEKIKKEMSKNFKGTKVEELEKNIDEYLKLKNQYHILRTYIIFENKFLNYYKLLNKYNKNFIDVFSTNRDIITKGSYLVIPDSGNEFLKDYGLLYTEDEFKEKVEAKKKQN